MDVEEVEDGGGTHAEDGWKKVDDEVPEGDVEVGGGEYCDFGMDIVVEEF